MKEVFAWWFNPKRPFSIIKIPYAFCVTVILGLSIVGNFRDFITAFRTEPLFTGLFLLFLPIFIIVFFADTIFAWGLLWSPYNVFEEEHSGWKALFKVLGIFLGVFIGLRLIRLLVFSGWNP